MHICTIPSIIPIKSYPSHVANLIPTSYASYVKQNSPRQAYVWKSRHHQSTDRRRKFCFEKNVASAIHTAHPLSTSQPPSSRYQFRRDGQKVQAQHGCRNPSHWLRYVARWSSTRRGCNGGYKGRLPAHWHGTSVGCLQLTFVILQCPEAIRI